MEKIGVHDLSFSIRNKHILSSVSLSVDKGSFIGIIGPNGSGKTTLLKHIYRIYPVDRAKIFINQKDICTMSIKETAAEMTVMRQENTSVFDYTNLQIVLMGRAPHKKIHQGYSKRDIEIARQALEYVDMAEYAEQYFSTLSGGEKQRILMARSLAQETDILILDEPTNHLDIFYQWHLMKLIKKLNKTVLAVFHDLNIALEYCDFIYVMNKGKIIAEGIPENILTSQMLKDVFNVDAYAVKSNKNSKRIIINESV